MSAVVEVHGNARVAVELAAAGFSVFPCHNGGGQAKRPMPGVFWRSASTSDRVKVSGWWRKWPDAAVGLDLAKSGLVVIDADRHGEADGVEAVAALMHQHGFDPNPVPTVATPNQGTHFYFRQPSGAVLGNARGALPSGIDVRGSGGYVIAPGSVMDDGRLYEGFGAIHDAPVLPDWLLAVISGPAAPSVPLRPLNPTRHSPPSDTRIAAYLDRGLQDELDAVRYAPRGQRNHQLNISSMKIGQMVGAGWIGEAEAVSLLEGAAAELTADDGPAQTAKTIRSGMTKGKSEPREMPDDHFEVVSEEDFAASERIRRAFDARLAVSPPPQAIDTLDTASTAPQFDLPDSYLHPPGVVGELADWICSWTAEPIRIHAVGAALVIVGTIIGRKIYSKTRPSSAALYIGAIAPSGMGKQHPQDAIRLALDEVQGSSALHCGWNVSLPALVMALHTNASKVMVADEFADKLIGLRSKNASTSQSAISEGLRSLWGTNAGTYSPDVSLARGDAKIMRPHLSFYGASTVKDFTRSLVSKDVTNGLFNRFLILPRFGEVQRKTDPDGIMQLPEPLKDRLQWLSACLSPMQLTMAARGDGYPADPILVPFDATADQMNNQNLQHQRAMLLASERDDALMLWGRFAEQVKRVAMIVAVGRSPGDPGSIQITQHDMTFATDLVRYSIEQFIGMVRRDMVESWVQAQHKLVLGIVRAAGTISRNELVRKVDGRIKGRDVEELIKTLDAGENIELLKVAPGPKGGRPKEIIRYVQG